MYIGIDVGGTNLVAGIVDINGKILAKAKCPTKSERGADFIINDCIGIARKVCGNAGISEDDIFSIGIGLPGTVDQDKGNVVFCPNIPFVNIPLACLIRSQWDIPVRLVNDANAAAYGEAVAGSARGCPNMVFITIGTGIGGGIVIDGKLFTGFNGMGGELGHIVIEYDGIQCGCGRKGCWEKYASASALIRITREYMERDKESAMWNTASSLEKVDGRTAFIAARNGDVQGKAVVYKYARYLSCGLSSIINCFQPEVLSIGGGVCNEGDYLLDLIKENVQKDTFKHTERNTELRIASLGNDAGIIGAALIGVPLKV